MSIRNMSHNPSKSKLQSGRRWANFGDSVDTQSLEEPTMSNRGGSQEGPSLPLKIADFKIDDYMMSKE